MEKYSLYTFVPNILKDLQGERLTALEVARLILDRYPEACRAKQSRSRAVVVPLDSEKLLLQQISSEISSQREVLEARFNIKTTEGRPRRFFFSTRSDSDDVLAVETPTPSLPAPQQLGAGTVAVSAQGLSEADLYPLLSRFLFSELNLYSKRIDEKRSRNSRGPSGNKWLHPDLVGMEPLTKNWKHSIIECAAALGATRAKLYSFEVKLLLNRSNIRESYFQAVSNSSWANFAYLVAADIHGGTVSELRVLAGTHGVGVILLNPEDTTASEIVIPARERPEIDWNSANRLAAENPDFVEFIDMVRHFYQSRDLGGRKWDYGDDSK